MTSNQIRIISGGQTGVDRGALDAALEAGVPCGGWCPAGRRAEDGTIDSRYPLSSLTTHDYADRTRRNVADSDATLVIYFGRITGGTAQTVEFCKQLNRPYLLVDASKTRVREAVGEVLVFLRSSAVRNLNVAGPRASAAPAAHDYSRELIRLVLAV